VASRWRLGDPGRPRGTGKFVVSSEATRCCGLAPPPRPAPTLVSSMASCGPTCTLSVPRPCLAARARRRVLRRNPFGSCSGGAVAGAATSADWPVNAAGGQTVCGSRASGSHVTGRTGLMACAAVRKATTSSRERKQPGNSSRRACSFNACSGVAPHTLR